MGEQLNEAKSQLDAVLAEINQIALSIPNLPADEVPLGKDDTENKEILRWGHRVPLILRSKITCH